MKDKPIIFSAPMVRALLAGRKIHTRRIVKPQPDHFQFGHPMKAPYWKGQSEITEAIQCPYGSQTQQNGMLWVRETFAYVGSCDPGNKVYRATYPQCAFDQGLENVPDDLRAAGHRWTPAIHMPRVASRLTLDICSIRVERLQDISEQDAKFEGVEPMEGGFQGQPHGLIHPTAKQAFQMLWNSINGPGAWNENPFVWVVAFHVERRNIDAR